MLSREIQSDFGRYLRECRMQTGRSLDEIAVQTKITPSCLQQLENEDLHHLPQDVYVRGLLKSFAEAVGGDTEEVIRRYRNCRNLQRRFEGQETSKSYEASFWRRLLVALLLFALAVGIALYGIQMVKSVNSQPLESGRKEGRSTDQAPLAESPASDQVLTVTESQATGPTALKLKATAVAPTRLKIIADGRLPQIFEMQPGEEIAVTAEAHLNILIVNAGGVRLTLNGKNVNVPGKDGQIVTLDLPQT